MERGSLLFFFNDTATTEIYTLSLHDALPISGQQQGSEEILDLEQPRADILLNDGAWVYLRADSGRYDRPDRKSTRLNSSHANISYAVFCLKKKMAEGMLTFLLSMPTTHSRSR